MKSWNIVPRLPPHTARDTDGASISCACSYQVRHTQFQRHSPTHTYTTFSTSLPPQSVPMAEAQPSPDVQGDTMHDDTVPKAEPVPANADQQERSSGRATPVQLSMKAVADVTQRREEIMGTVPRLRSGLAHVLARAAGIKWRYMRKGDVDTSKGDSNGADAVETGHRTRPLLPAKAHRQALAAASTTRYSAVGVSEQLLRLIFELDGIQTHGDADVRSARKAEVLAVQNAMEEADALKVKAAQTDDLVRKLLSRVAVAPEPKPEPETQSAHAGAGSAVDDSCASTTPRAGEASDGSGSACGEAAPLDAAVEGPSTAASDVDAPMANEDGEYEESDAEDSVGCSDSDEDMGTATVSPVSPPAPRRIPIGTGRPFDRFARGEAQAPSRSRAAQPPALPPRFTRPKPQSLRRPRPSSGVTAGMYSPVAAAPRRQRRRSAAPVTGHVMYDVFGQPVFVQGAPSRWAGEPEQAPEPEPEPLLFGVPRRRCAPAARPAFLGQRRLCSEVAAACSVAGSKMI